MKCLKLKKHEKVFSRENLIDYVRFSGGAMELHEDYVVFYKNILPFSWNVWGRRMHLINIEDIDYVAYKGPGWFPGMLVLMFKHYKRPFRVAFTKLFVWRRKKLFLTINRMAEILNKKVMIGWKKESYRKIETVDQIKKDGYCPNCGNSLEQDQKFCPNCGNRIF